MQIPTHSRTYTHARTKGHAHKGTPRTRTQGHAHKGTPHAHTHTRARMCRHKHAPELTTVHMRSDQRIRSDQVSERTKVRTCRHTRALTQAHTHHAYKCTASGSAVGALRSSFAERSPKHTHTTLTTAQCRAARAAPCEAAVPGVYRAQVMAEAARRVQASLSARSA